MKIRFYALLMLLVLAVPAFATVAVSSPQSGVTASSPVRYVASANTTTCSQGVASMGIYVDNVLKYVRSGSNLDALLPLNPGSYRTVVQAWDRCGHSSYTAIYVKVMGNAGVFVTSPLPNSQVTSPVAFVATASTNTCAKGVASMGIYVNNKLAYALHGGQKINTQLSLSAGTQHAVVKEWDYCGGVLATPVNLNVIAPAPAMPKVVLTASPTTIVAGSTSTLTATASNATQVIISGADIGSHTLPSAGGSVAIVPTATATYTATAIGAGGQAVASTVITLVPPPPSLPLPAPGTVLSNLQTNSTAWQSFGQVGPNYVDCSPSPCEGITWSMQNGVTLPSLSNNATEFKLGGTAKYGDVLFTAPLIGNNHALLQDSDHTLLPTLHNFTYDTDFYVTNASITQALEFDISFWMGSQAGMTFGTQCNYLGDHDWDVYDNSQRKWVSAGVPCKFVEGWNHLTIQVQRESDNSSLYKSIALNGTVYLVNKTTPGVVAHPTWWGINLNFQMDGNSTQAPNTAYLDNLTFTYW